MTDLIERLRIAAKIHEDIGGQSALAATIREAAAALEAAREDSERLDSGVEGFVSVDADVYDFAQDVADDNNRDEPSREDYNAGFRRLIDAARKEVE